MVQIARDLARVDGVRVATTLPPLIRFIFFVFLIREDIWWCVYPYPPLKKHPVSVLSSR